MLKGRISKGVGGLYSVVTEEGIYSCQARGLFRKQKIQPLVGDFVEISIVDEQKKEGYLQNIFERKNELLRPKVANIDIAVIVFAATYPDIHIELLDQFLILAEERKIESVICINKIDLDEKNILSDIQKAYSLAGYKVVGVSAETGEGISEIKKLMVNNVSVFAGPSGVGKSSIINAVKGDSIFEVGSLSEKIERGKHTTRHTELVQIDKDTFILDSPGFTSMSITHIPKSELQFYYPEIAKLRSECMYSNCLHVKETDCKVKEMIDFAIDKERYERYVKFVEQ